MKDLLEYAEDLSVTTTYIFSELMESPLFFSNIDKAVEIAKAFIDKFPSGTDWEQTEYPWEETLYNFFLEYKK